MSASEKEMDWWGNGAGSSTAVGSGPSPPAPSYDYRVDVLRGELDLWTLQESYQAWAGHRPYWIAVIQRDHPQDRPLTFHFDNHYVNQNAPPRVRSDAGRQLSSYTDEPSTYHPLSDLQMRRDIQAVAEETRQREDASLAGYRPDWLDEPIRELSAE